MAKKRFGYIAEVPNLYDNLTVGEHISFIKRAYDVKEDEHIEKLIELLELKDKINATAKELSKGMKQKVSIVISILHDPSIIIFDEPTNGLDVLTAKTVTDFLLELRTQGRTVIVSTHIFSLVEKLCDRVGILINGQMIVCEPLAELTKEKCLEDVFFDIYQKAAGEQNG